MTSGKKFTNLTNNPMWQTSTRQGHIYYCYVEQWV